MTMRKPGSTRKERSDKGVKKGYRPPKDDKSSIHHNVVAVDSRTHGRRKHMPLSSRERRDVLMWAMEREDLIPDMREGGIL